MVNIQFIRQLLGKSAAEALRQKETIGDRLLKAFERRRVELFALVWDSPHGEELDINSQVAADILLAAAKFKRD